MKGAAPTAIKLGVFIIVMVLLTTCLFFTFGQYRTGTTRAYSAVMADASRLKTGDSVRVAGVRVGTVNGIALRDDNAVVVSFDVDETTALTTGTKVAVRYLNLVGDRFLELLDGPASSPAMLPVGAQIPIDRTSPALDLDLLLGGLRPVIQGLNANEVNALTSSLLQIFQGQGDTMHSLLSKSASFTATVATRNQAIGQLIDNLKGVMDVLAEQGNRFSGALDRLQQLVSALAQDRDPIGEAIDSLSKGTASLADLMSNIRQPLAGTVDQVNRLAPLLDSDKERIDAALQRAPDNYRKLIRLGAYGSFIQYYLCGITIRVTDLQGRTAVFPWIKQETGRCAEP